MGVLICLYDWAGDVDWFAEEHRLQNALSWFGCPIDHFQYGLNPKKSPGGRKSRLEKLAVADLWYVGVFGFGDRQKDFLSPAAACVTMLDRAGKGHYLFLDDADILADSDRIRAWLHEALAEKPEAVGFARAMNRDDMPEAFATGVSTLSTTAEERDATLRWFVDRRDNASSQLKLRNIFPINVLPRRYLDAPVGAVSLRHWIETNGDKGNVIEARDLSVIWTVDPAHASQIRSELSHAQRLY